MANKASPTYARSELLSNEENTIIREMYAPKQEVMACTVAQLFQAAPNPRVWTKKNTGVACVVKDHNQRSYFIHVVNIDTHTVVHSEEFYLEMDYRTPYPYFHTFPGEKCMVGLNFCHDGEAQLFLDAVNGIINRNKKRKEKIDAQNRPPPAAVMPPPTNNIPVPEPVTPLSKKDKKKKDKKKDKKKKGISKADISGPSNFKHLSHLGWDETKNKFDDSQAHPLFKQLLNAAGVKANELDESTAKFITDYVDQMGGIETLEKPAGTTKPSGRPPPPAPPSRGGGAPPAPPSSNRGAPPPPPGPRAGGRAPPPARNDRGPPPPAPHRQGPPPPPPSKAPPAPAAPPAPKAPPAPAAPRAPPAPALAKVAPGAPPPPPGKGNLLDEIRRGKQLQSAANNPLPAAPAGGGGGDLMSAIRGFGGARGGLKAANKSECSSKSGTPRSDRSADNRPEPEPEDKLEGMAGALARALAERNKHLAVDSDKSDSESDDDWSD
eukprot:sb/3464151/